MDESNLLLDSLESLGERAGANLLFLVSDRRSFLETAIERAKIPVVVATSKEDLQEAFQDQVRAVLLTSETLEGSFNVLGQLKDILLGAYLEGTLSPGDDVLVLVGNREGFDVVVHFDVDEDMQLSKLRGELAERIDMKVVERVLRLCAELSREGREGTPVGTLFTIGDVDRVMNHSRQVVINPFLGHPEEDRNILHDTMWETVKEFAQLDGAFVLRNDGVVEAAGRYIETNRKVEVQSGLGGRHLAAASITDVTDCVAVTVSTSGAIRIFKDGKIIMMVGRF